jgi:enamine deaminase RidA (YjgF/YER057c/UK114 family)
LEDGKLVATGKVPNDVSLEDARQAARIAGLNALAAAADAAGGIDNIQRILNLTVFVNSSPGFHDQAKVANGASDLMAGVFGEFGIHTRAAVGAAELPLNAAVELTLTAQISR